MESFPSESARAGSSAGGYGWGRFGAGPQDRPNRGSPERRTLRRLLLATALVLVVLAIYLLARRLVGADRFTIEKTRPVLSQVDGMRYRVHEGHPSPQRAADMLAILNGRVVDLMRHLRTRYLRGAEGELFPARRGAVSRLLARYNPDNLAENSPKDLGGDSSYTIDKGGVVALCIREKNPAADIHNLGILTFVTLHEMSHIAIDAVDHPKQFWEAFRFLLEEAEVAGVYRSPNYAIHPEHYCGVNVDYNPRFDPGTVSI